jgi:hypothetical protein
MMITGSRRDSLTHSHAQLTSERYTAMSVCADERMCMQHGATKAAAEVSTKELQASRAALCTRDARSVVHAKHCNSSS